jgi:hypothetical protein
MQNHLSVNAAAEMLERTRRTVKRALRNTPPDSYEHGQPRWRLPKIIQALESSGAPMTQPRYAVTGNDLVDQCDAAFAQFDAAFEKLKALPTLATRRAAAIKLFPMAEMAIAAMQARDAADGLHPDHVALRGDRVFHLLMIRFEGPCGWSRNQVWEQLIPDEEDVAGA